jgi:hypothetical protein
MSLDWLVPNVTHVSGLTCTQCNSCLWIDMYPMLLMSVNPETWVTLDTRQSRDMSNIGYKSIQRHESHWVQVNPETWETLIHLYPMLLMSLDWLVPNVTHVSGLTCTQCYSCLWIDLYPMWLMSLETWVTLGTSQSRDMSHIGYKSIQRHE